MGPTPTALIQQPLGPQMRAGPYRCMLIPMAFLCLHYPPSREVRPSVCSTCKQVDGYCGPRTADRFAYTDAAYANHYFIWICSPQPSETKCEDLSPAIESRFLRSAPKDSEVDKRYSKALKWLSEKKLLVGFHAVSSRETEKRGNYTPVHWHYKAYIVSVAADNYLSDMEPKAVKEQLGRSLESLQW